LINLTPHPVTIYHQGKVLTIPPSGNTARVSCERKEAYTIMGIPVAKNEWGEVLGLPPEEPGTFFIVSMLVMQALGESRPDLLSPDTGKDAVRDEDGRIIAVRRFIRS